MVFFEFHKEAEREFESCLISRVITKMTVIIGWVDLKCYAVLCDPVFLGGICSDGAVVSRRLFKSWTIFKYSMPS